MLTVTAIAADHLSSTFTNYIRAMASYRDCPVTVESRCGAVALGLACLFPSLSFDGALVANQTCFAK